MLFKFSKTVASFYLAIGTLAAANAGEPKEPITVDADDQAIATNELGGSRKLALSTIPMRHLDGVKGYKVYFTFEGPTLKQPEQLRRRIAHLACNSAVFGLVELEKSKSFVGKADVGVFTKFRFRLLDDWRAIPAEKGRDIHLIMQGGEVTFAGEKIRVENPYASYKVGGQYIIAAGRANGDAAQKPIFQTPPFHEVNDNLVHPAPDGALFAPGTTLEQAKTIVKDAVAKEGC